jgi:hypothetical protein
MALLKRGFIAIFGGLVVRWMLRPFRQAQYSIRVIAERSVAKNPYWRDCKMDTSFRSV